REQSMSPPSITRFAAPGEQVLARRDAALRNMWYNWHHRLNSEFTMELSGSRLNVLSAVLGLGLCVAMVTAAPMASESFDDDVSPNAVHTTAQELQSVVHLLHSLLSLNERRYPATGPSDSLFARSQARKRGFGKLSTRILSAVEEATKRVSVQFKPQPVDISNSP
ncbi:hypothetical protein BaRGS_00027273, partial [Batillaria attramentaria]